MNLQNSSISSKQSRIYFWLLIALSILIVGISITYYSLAFGKPIMGATLSLEKTGWTVESIDANGIAARAGIQIGDVPTQINGQPADQFLSKYSNQKIVYGMAIKDLTVTNPHGTVISVSLSESRQPTSSLIETLILLLTCLIFWAIGLFVYIKRPNTSAARLLLGASLALGLVICSNIAAERSILQAYRLTFIAGIFGPWVLTHFFIMLPEEKTRLKSRIWIFLIYLIPSVLSILSIFKGFENDQALPWFKTIRLIEYGIGFLALLCVVLFNYTKAPSPKSRQQMRIVLISCFLALVPFLLIYLIPQIFTNNTIMPAGYLVPLLDIIPLGMGYAVITTRLLDIDILIRRGVIYITIAFLMTIILAAAIVPIISMQHTLNPSQAILISLALGIIATVLFGPIRKGIENAVDKLFYKDRYDYRQIIQSLSISLNSLSELSDISRLIVGTCKRTLNLSGVGLFLKNPNTVFDVQASEGTFSDPDKQIQLLTLVYKHDPEIDFPNPATPANADLAFFIPLKADNRNFGYLCLSHKNNRQVFSSDDIYLLQGVASVATTALHSAILAHDVSLRDTFVSIASHELRTPLTSVIGYADLILRKDPPADTRKQWLLNIQENGQKIADLVDDLLNVTRIQSGKYNLKLSEVKLHEVVANRLPIIQDSTNIHSFIITVPHDLPSLWADRDKLGQILNNLLSNAVKYSPGGGIIRVSANYLASDNTIEIAIEDHGMGISKDNLSTLFKTFHRIQRPETRGIRGSGLGLYIVKEWVEAMGGRVWLESELNKGSIFHFSIPAINK